MQQLKGQNCYESDKDKYGMVEVRTCLGDTENVCCLLEGETGSQRTGVINWRSHVSTVKIRIRSLNEKITLAPEEGENDESYEHVEEAYVAPSMGDDINEYEFQVPAKRESGGTATSETIQLSLTIDTEKAAEDSREGPTLHSRIQFK